MSASVLGAADANGARPRDAEDRYGSKVRVPAASPARLKHLQEQTKSLRCREEALRATKSVLRETSTEQVMQVHCDEGVAIQIGAKVPARAWTKRSHGYAQASHRAAKVASNRVPIAALLAEGNTEGCVNTSAWTWSQTLACAETP